MAILDQKNEISLLKMESKKDQAELNSQRQQLYFTIGFSVLLVLILFILLINYKNKTKLNRVLRDKNQEIKNRGLQLESALYEKSLMLKEMHHRVKNNLQLVQSLLRLQSAEISDTRVAIAFEESINRLTSMSLIHQNLYQQEKLKHIEFKSYLESLLEQLKGSFKNSEKQIKLELEAEELNLSIDNSVPVGLIVNELISNSFQHGFENKISGTIKVSIEKNESQVSLNVSDNGNGLNQDFSLENKSFGTTLIKMLVEQIQGKITFHNENGAHFNITFEDKPT
jgi:two-component sensor histidine kinase